MAIKIKQGATLEITAVKKDANNNPVDLSSVVIKSSIRSDNGSVYYGDFVVTKSPVDNGEFTLSASSAITSKWPITTLVADIKYTTAGEVEYTTNFFIQVEKAVTQ